MVRQSAAAVFFARYSERGDNRADEFVQAFFENRSDIMVFDTLAQGAVGRVVWQLFVIFRGEVSEPLHDLRDTKCERARHTSAKAQELGNRGGRIVALNGPAE